MRLQDIIDAGGVCVYAGVQKRPLVELGTYTQQGGQRGTAGDAVAGAVRGMTPGRLPLMPASMAGRLSFGKGAR